MYLLFLNIVELVDGGCVQILDDSGGTKEHRERGGGMECEELQKIRFKYLRVSFIKSSQTCRRPSYNSEVQKKITIHKQTKVRVCVCVCLCIINYYENPTSCSMVAIATVDNIKDLSNVTLSLYREPNTKSRPGNPTQKNDQ